MTNRFTEHANEALAAAFEAASELGHTYVGSEHLMLGLLAREDTEAGGMLADCGLERDAFREAVEDAMGSGERTQVGAADMTPRTKRILEIAAIQAQRDGNVPIGTEHLLFGLVAEGSNVALQLASQIGADLDALRETLASHFGIGSGASDSGEEREDGGRRGAGHASGKKERGDIHGAPTLSKYGRDLTALAKEGKIDPIIGRDAEMERVIQILSRRQKNNPCLIGEPGVGKTAVVEGLAQKIVSGDVPELLRDKRVVTLDIPAMIAGAKYRGEFEERLKGVMEEIRKNPDIILFIDEFHTLVGAGGAEGAIDAANILKPALSRAEIQIIGATTLDEYRKHIEKDAALERRFQSVLVGEPTPEEAVRILEGLREKYEAHHKLKISDEALRAAVQLSVRYISDRYLPDKAIDLIDEAASRMRISHMTAPAGIKEREAELKKLEEEKEKAVAEQDYETAASLRDRLTTERAAFEKEKQNWVDGRGDDALVVGEQEIAEIVTAWTKIPVSRLLEGESERLLRLEDTLHERIIGQDDAVSAVARAIRRGRVGLKNPKRPIGSFIFLGPTGVGKTELTKVLADVMFGSENAMIRIDMSEYMEKHAVSKLIGSPPGYVGFEEGGQLTEQVRRHPYSVILLDEIEKAHPDVFNILLQILEDGILTDSQGRHVDFKNTIIIMTSNAGAEGLVSHGKLGFASSSDSDAERDQVRDGVMNALRATFRPEFLNRVDEIIVFNKLVAENMKEIAGIMLADLKKRIAEIGVEITFSDEAVTLLSEKGFDPVYGARPLRRVITRMVEDPFSGEMLEGHIREGDRVTAVVRDSAIVYETSDGGGQAGEPAGSAGDEE